MGEILCTQGNDFLYTINFQEFFKTSFCNQKIFNTFFIIQVLPSHNSITLISYTSKFWDWFKFKKLKGQWHAILYYLNALQLFVKTCLTTSYRILLMLQPTADYLKSRLFQQIIELFEDLLSQYSTSESSKFVFSSVFQTYIILSPIGILFLTPLLLFPIHSTVPLFLTLLAK